MAGWVKSGLANTFRLILADADEPIEVRTTPADAVAWEANNKGQSFQNNVSASSLLWTAWRRLRVDGVIEDRFEKFVDRVQEFEIARDDEDEGDGDAVDPSRTDPLAG